MSKQEPFFRLVPGAGEPVQGSSLGPVPFFNKPLPSPGWPAKRRYLLSLWVAPPEGSVGLLTGALGVAWSSWAPSISAPNQPLLGSGRASQALNFKCLAGDWFGWVT